MPRVRDFLDRFRPAGAPGAASGAGVPVDRRAAVEAELVPVLAALDEAQRECARLRQAAETRAAEIRAEAAARAEQITARAAADAAATRARAAAAVRRSADDEIAELNERADRDADEVRRAARQRAPELIARTVAAARAELAGVAEAELVAAEHAR
ncbi:hypothetical protein ACNTMW_24925 [Planosporangium sp. 12N6]|uniref:hypothetical protein n=1 Tax=Planosporangium spinosum TaxID=3402278 RepID=UPI003CEC6A00